MKFKLDENVGLEALEILHKHGFDAMTVPQQSLSGADDNHVAAVCRNESRILVTMDVEFANPVLYPPHLHGGIVVLRAPGRCTSQMILLLMETLCQALLTKDEPNESMIPLKSPEQHLWIVEPGRVRLYQDNHSR